MAPFFTPGSPGNKPICPGEKGSAEANMPLATFRKTFPTELSMLTDRDK